MSPPFKPSYRTARAEASSPKKTPIPARNRGKAKFTPPRHSALPKSPQNPKSPKSSIEARRLLRAAVRRFGSQRKAAAALHISSQAAFNKMLHGTLRDTKEMKAAILRADNRSKSAWLMVKLETVGDLDKSALAVIVKDVEQLLENIKALL